MGVTTERGAADNPLVVLGRSAAGTRQMALGVLLRSSGCRLREPMPMPPGHGISLKAGLERSDGWVVDSRCLSVPGRRSSKANRTRSFIMRALPGFGAALSMAALIIYVSSCAMTPGAGSGGRLTNADVTILSFGSVHGEHDHCG